MGQTKRKSALETLTQTVTGLAVSMLIQIWLYPLMGIPVTLSQNAIITTVFFAASLIRGYAVRRLFNRV